MKTSVVSMGVVVLLSVCCMRPTVALGPSFVRFGFCSDVLQQPDFDMEQFTGLWYGILRVSNEYSPLKRCITSHYTSVDENGKFTNSRDGVAENGTEVHSELELMVLDDELYSYFIPAGKLRPEIGVTVAETDYTNFACVYSCIQRFTFKAEFVAVMSRTPSIKKAYVEQCKTTITEQSGFDWSHLSMVEQGETCPYWPDHVEKMEQKKLEETKMLEEMVEAVDQAVMSEIKEDMKESEEMEELVYFEPSSADHNDAGLDFRVLLFTLFILFV